MTFPVSLCSTKASLQACEEWLKENAGVSIPWMVRADPVWSTSCEAYEHRWD